MAVYLEHTGGDLPLWLSPVQAIVLAVSEKSREYGESVAAALKKAGLRGHLDDRNEKIGAKIRQAELQKIPAMLIIGEREAANGTVSLRRRHLGDQGNLSVDDLVTDLLREVRDRKRSPAHSQG